MARSPEASSATASRAATYSASRLFLDGLGAARAGPPPRRAGRAPSSSAGDRARRRGARAGLQDQPARGEPAAASPSGRSVRSAAAAERSSSEADEEDVDRRRRGRTDRLAREPQRAERAELVRAGRNAGGDSRRSRRRGRAGARGRRPGAVAPALSWARHPPGRARCGPHCPRPSRPRARARPTSRTRPPQHGTAGAAHALLALAADRRPAAGPAAARADRRLLQPALGYGDPLAGARAWRARWRCWPSCSTTAPERPARRRSTARRHTDLGSPSSPSGKLEAALAVAGIDSDVAATSTTRSWRPSQERLSHPFAVDLAAPTIPSGSPSMSRSTTAC